MKSTKWYSNAMFVMGCVAALFVWLFLLWCISGCQAVGFANEPTTPKFDTSALESWCGQPSGTIRMVGAEFDGVDTFTDETGEMWGWEDDSLKENGFYLLWIDDNGTSDLRDDFIVKVFQEK